MLEENIYIQAPECIKVKHNQCLKLKKALYGLKQAPEAWHKKFDSVLKELGFAPTLVEPCIYVNKRLSAIMLIYVDDALIFAPDEKICCSVIDSLERHFKLKRVNNRMFLGINIDRNENVVCLNQNRYICQMAERFGQMEGKNVSTPMVDFKELFVEDDDDSVDQGKYQSLIGSLLYCAMCTRFDTLFSIIVLSRFNQCAKAKHMLAAQRVLRYLYCTKDLNLVYEKKMAPPEILVFSDADHVSDPTTRKSTSGSLIMINRCPVIWLSRQQKVNAQSSCESELIATREALKSMSWLTNLLDELGQHYNKPQLLVDNQATIKTIQNREVKRGLKHIEIAYYYPITLFEQKKYRIEYIESENQLADCLTKSIPADPLFRHRKASGLQEFENESHSIDIIYDDS